MCKLFTLKKLKDKLLASSIFDHANIDPCSDFYNIHKLNYFLYSLQVINNACATQAIVSVLLNCTHQDIHLGETLSEFKEFSQSFDAAVCVKMIFGKMS